MPLWLPSIPYAAPDQPGFWAPVTSTINWCEEDYYITFYAAEIVNTGTNLLFILLALKGLFSCHRHGHDSVFAVAYAGLFAVGCGSLLFHASLKYPMQLVDELSMIYTGCLLAYNTFSYSRGLTFRVVLAIALVILSSFVTLYYHYLQDPTFHQSVFAILSVVVFLREILLMEHLLRPSFQNHQQAKAKGPKAHAHLRARDSKILRDMWTLVAFSLMTSLGGFAIWTLDNVYCSRLRDWRRRLGLPWGLLLEGHGWWHIMTGIGAYFFIVWSIWLRHCLNHRQDEYELLWPRIYQLPEVVRSEPRIKNSNSLRNGSTKIQ